jgi:hypothetical protein
MADYQTMTLTNLPLECCIQIAAVKTGVEPGDVTKVVIKRKLHDSSTWVSIGSMDITTVDSFTFTVKDYNTRSRYTYDYILIPCVGDTEGTGIQSTMKCDFYDIYISDTTATYICVLNAKKTAPERHSQFATVETLGSKYPYIVRNGITNYLSGTITGLFLPPPTTGSNYTQESARTAESRDYKDDVLAFLNNGITKTIKTYDGFVWYAGITNAKEVDNDNVDGASEISADWIELGAPLTTGVVVVV